MANEQGADATIIGLEQAALERWGKGDPSGFLEISAPDVVYFDPYLKGRLDGLEDLTRLYAGVRGNLQFDRCELIHPKVQLCGEAAVLTFNFVSFLGETEKRWNCTEVYHRTDARWEIIQTHWSYTQPFK